MICELKDLFFEFHVPPLCGQIEVKMSQIQVELKVDPCFCQINIETSVGGGLWAVHKVLN
jgi:hypothetical protein